MDWQSENKVSKLRKIIKVILIELRPVQWMKNLFLFAGLIFSFSFTEIGPILQSILAFIVFCLASSSVYILNDIIDREVDRFHPKKRVRPIASGELRIGQAILVSIILAVVALILSILLSRSFFFVCFTYILLMISYSIGLKKIIILDVIIVSFGFILRAVAGAVVINVEISPWLLLTTFLLALFLGLCKRRYEITLLGESAHTHRNTLFYYSSYLLDQMIAVVTASTVVTYAMYTMAKETYLKFGTRLLGLTVPFVIYGIFRYLYLVHREEEGGSPEKTLFTDKPLLIDIILWSITAILIIYLSQRL
ncbi:decaprenyl-phosphate phosphoribosyltransferase [candidate division WOR-3 bacterium]|nr:decaprenyl-phosphate phosphoribosyltransferase [candidate division WOR-3 bacterium]